MSNSRRGFLKISGLAALGSGAFLRMGSAQAAESLGGRPRHIIHMVSDGTSMGTLTLGDYFSHLTRKRGLRWLELSQQPGACTALVNMRSLDSIVTDSAAASSSWGSGSRVRNGAINQLPDGRDLLPLCSVFAEEGWRRGLVTTTEITHATPAGFAANVGTRDTADAIADQYVRRKIDVLLGGGSKYFSIASRKDKKDLFATARSAGYFVMEKAQQLEQAPLDVPWLGTFASGHLPFTLDWMADKDTKKKVPHLAEMTRAALKKLGSSDHFILQVEGGRVDHGAHNNDIATTMHDLVAFDEALDVCLEFVEKTPETLLVVTTDHGTGNPGLNGTGSNYKDSKGAFARTLKARRSTGEILTRIEKDFTVANIQKVTESHTGYKVPEAKATILSQFLGKKGTPLYDGLNSASSQLGQLLANYYGVSWTSSAHTADFVPLVARGPGSSRFRGFIQNTDVFRGYLDLASIDFRNPQAPLLAMDQATPETLSWVEQHA